MKSAQFFVMINNVNLLLIFIMNKETKHSKAEEFRRKIVFPGQRAAVINELLKKRSFDCNDQMKLVLLFQKVSYLDGCEVPYRILISHVRQVGDPGLVAKTNRFFQKLSK